jgi:hypothetical protein
MFRRATTGAILIAFSAVSLPSVPAQAQTDSGKYQIVKSTETRVWRLNKETGEIAVCDLDGANLVCTTSSDAAEVPKKSYEELEQEKAAAAKASEQQMQAEREKELKMLDKAITLLREFVNTALGKEAAN